MILFTMPALILNAISNFTFERVKSTIFHTLTHSNVKLLIAFSIISSPLLGAAAASKEESASEMPPPHLKSSVSNSYISIPIKDRALDLQQAFDLLKREKTSGKVYFQFSDGSTISNIINITLLPNNSLILFRYNSNNQGIRLQVVKVEDIVGLSYY